MAPGGPAWWLDAFDAFCPAGALTPPERGHPGFEECVEYALS